MELLTIKTWIEGVGLSVIVSFVVGILAQKGWTLVIRKWAGRASIVMKEVGEAILEGSEFAALVNQSIKDNGKLKENSLQELRKASKELKAELDDVIIVIKPKKTTALKKK